VTKAALAFAIALGVGVAVRPSTPGAVAVVAVATVAALYRRQDSEDSKHSFRMQVLKAKDRVLLAHIEEANKKTLSLVEKHAAELEALRSEFDRVKLMVPRPK